MKDVQFEGVDPILRVENLKRALDVGKLGFKNADWAIEDFTSVARGKGSIYLRQSDQGRGGAWVWVGVTDADELHRQHEAAGVKILMKPTNYPWALEFHVEDPDGNVLRFGSDPQ
jgi:predicted enzyme related to lactoylglutathione lyase